MAKPFSSFSSFRKSKPIFPPITLTQDVDKKSINIRDIISYLRKPSDAIATVFNNELYGGNKTPIEAFIKGWQGKGTTPEKLTDKIFDSIDIQPDKTTRTLSKIAIGIGIDPLTYIPLSLPFKAAAQVARKIPTITKGIKALRNSKLVDIPANTLSKMFNPAHDVPAIFRSIYNKKQFLTIGASDRFINIVKNKLVEPYNKLDDVSKKFVNEVMEKWTPDKSLADTINQVTDYFQKAGLKVIPNEDILKVLNRSDKLRKVIEKMELSAGLDYKRITASGYLLHHINPKHHELLHRLYPETSIFGVRYLNSAKNRSMLHRSTHYVEVKRGLVEELFKDDPMQFIILKDGIGENRWKQFGDVIRLPIASPPFGNRLQIAAIAKKLHSLPQEMRDALYNKYGRLQYKSYTISEINKLAESGKLELLYDKKEKITHKVKNFLIEDLPTLMAVRGVRGIRSVNQAKYIEEVINTAKQLNLAQEGGGVTVLSSGGKFGYSKYVKNVLKRNIVFDAEVAEHLDKIESITPLAPEYQEALNYFDKIQNVWKWWTLVPVPSYHFRNAVGNVWNNYLAGVRPEAYKIAADIMRGKEGFIANTNLTYGILRKEIEKWGVSGRGQLAIETSLNQLKTKLYGAPGQKIAAFGEMNENLARIANYIDGRIFKKLSSQDSRLIVAKFLFDYQDLTTFERNVLRKVFPFYAWTRKNVPLQLENIFKQTGKYTALERILYNLEQDKPQEEFIPDFIKDNNPVFVGADKDGKARAFMLSSYIPAYDLQKVLGQYGDTLQEMLTPIIKAPLEFFNNYSTYYKKSLEKYKGQSTNFLGVNMPIRIVNLLKNMRLLNELDKLNPGLIFGTNEVPGIFGVTRGQRVEPEYTLRWINFFSGIKLTSIDLDIIKKQYLEKLHGNILYLKGMQQIYQRTGKIEDVRIIENLINKYEKQFQEISKKPSFVSQ